MSRKNIKSIIGWLAAVVILFFLIRIIIVNREELSARHWDFDWPDLIMSALFLFIAYLTASQAWRTIIEGFGNHIRFAESFRVVYLANLGRYIPGKVWQVFGMVALAGEIGIPPRVSLASFALAQAYSLPASFVLIPIFLGQMQSIESLEVYRNVFYLIFLVVLVIFLFIFFKPDGFNKILNYLLRIFRREPVEYKPGLKNRLLIFVWYLLTWLCFGLSFFYFMEAMVGTPTLSINYAIGTYIAAYVLGYLSFISPGGLGFREGIMTALITPFLGVPTAASVALIHRIWITCFEAAISLLALLTYRLGPSRKS
jgi:uncharacterized membrane protein YbhN (UPF0104 family)